MRYEGLLCTALALFASGCLERRTDPTQEAGRCTRCHGTEDASRPELVQSAPPRDLYGNTSPEYPGVGAHALHLLASETHAAFACRECHVVPEQVDEPGHMDSARPAELVFGPLSSLRDHTPSYDAVARRCADTYCHKNDDAVWTRPRSTENACGTCHGLPPPPPHPDSTACFQCHANLREDRSFIDPAQHVDGVVQVTEPACSACHGEGTIAAPPRDTQGNTAVSAPGVGAHTAHRLGGAQSRPVACQSCHVVPRRSDDPGHLDALPAELVFSGVAQSFSREPSYDSTAHTCAGSWCHAPGASSSEAPPWTSEAGSLSCSSCHGMPPALPHPAMTNCATCHGVVVAEDNRSMRDRSRHVDGVVDVIDYQALPCNGCHGDTTPAPPRDLSGNTSTSFAGVGAHSIHLAGSDRARAVACSECHLVPESVDAPGHMDDPLPAEIVFSGPARAFGAQPSYANGVCSNTFCHGDSFVGRRPSGGVLTRPRWTVVDGTQSTCQSCHGMPPPPPHPVNADDCSRCHENIDANREFIYPELHVDGQVTFLAP